MSKYLIEEYSEMSSAKPKSSKKPSKESVKKSSKKPSKKPSKKSSKESVKKSVKKSIKKPVKKSSKKSSKKMNLSRISSIKSDEEDNEESDDEEIDEEEFVNEPASESSIPKTLKRAPGLGPAMTKIKNTNKYIADALGISIGPTLLSYIKEKFRDVAKKGKSDIEKNDYDKIEKEVIDIFENYLTKHKKPQILEEIEKKALEIKKKRADKKANKNK